MSEYQYYEFLALFTSRFRGNARLAERRDPFSRGLERSARLPG